MSKVEGMSSRVNRSVDRDDTKRYEVCLRVQGQGRIVTRSGGLGLGDQEPRRKMPCSSALVTAAVRSATFSLP